MRALAVMLVGCLLSSCGESPAPSPSGARSPGRYAGIGVFDTGRLWAEMTGSPASTDPAFARLEDDEHIIVVLDSHTGEVRQCGDHSGFCMAMNPWTAPGSTLVLPARLNKHASDLAAEDRAEAEPAATPANSAASSKTENPHPR